MFTQLCVKWKALMHHFDCYSAKMSCLLFVKSVYFLIFHCFCCMHIYLSQIALCSHLFHSCSFTCDWDFFVFICSLETFIWSFTGTSKVGVSPPTASAILTENGIVLQTLFTMEMNHVSLVRVQSETPTEECVTDRKMGWKLSVSVWLVSVYLWLLRVTSGYRLKMTPPAGHQLTHHPLVSLSLPIWLCQEYLLIPEATEFIHYFTW